MCNIVFSNLSFLSQHEKTIPAQFSSNLESPDSVSRIFVTLHYICTEISNHQPGMRGGNKEMRRGTRETSLRESNSAELFSSWPGIEVIQKYWDEYSDHKDELLIKLAGLSRPGFIARSFMFKSPGCLVQAV